MTSGWRICKRKYAEPPSSAFSGEGSHRFGGRWSGPGRRVAYASSSIALASLEYFVNLDPAQAPAGLVTVPVEIPPGIAVERVHLDQLPTGWESRPYPQILHQFGEAWLDRRTSVCLLVPSAVIPQEANLLINPAHQDFSRLLFGSPVEFTFDQRMWK